MAQHEVIAVIGQCLTGVDVGDCAIGGGQDRVGWFAVFVAFEAADVQALVHLPAFAADAAECAGDPVFASGADKEFLFAAFFEQGEVGGGEVEGLGVGGEGAESQKERCSDSRSRTAAKLAIKVPAKVGEGSSL